MLLWKPVAFRWKRFVENLGGVFFLCVFVKVTTLLGQKPAAKKSRFFPHLIKLMVPGLFLQLKQSTEQHEQELAKRPMTSGFLVVGDIFPGIIRSQMEIPPKKV